MTITIAALVIIFGLHRISMVFRSEEEERRARARKGLYGMGRRTHLLVGIIYVLLGSGLIANAFGWSPLAGLWSAGVSGTNKTAPQAK
jgi:hypothetical protein